MVHASSFFWAELQINLTKPVTMGMQWRKYHCTIAGGPHHVAVLSKSTVYPHFLQKLIITFPNNINVMFNDNINQKNHIICFFILPAYIHLVWWTPQLQKDLMCASKVCCTDCWSCWKAKSASASSTSTGTRWCFRWWFQYVKTVLSQWIYDGRPPKWLEST